MIAERKSFSRTVFWRHLLFTSAAGQFTVSPTFGETNHAAGELTNKRKKTNHGRQIPEVGAKAGLAETGKVQCGKP